MDGGCAILPCSAACYSWTWLLERSNTWIEIGAAEAAVMQPSHDVYNALPSTDERRKSASVRPRREGLFMVDTLVMYFPHPLRQPGAEWEPRYVHVDGQPHVDRYVRNSRHARLTLKHIGPQSMMLVEASLPVLLWGHNITLLTLADFIQASSNLAALVTAATPDEEIPPLEEWSLSRVDYCYSWNVGDPWRYTASINSALDCTRRQETKYHHTPKYGGDTLERFGGKSWREILYNKWAETQASLKDARPRPDDARREQLLDLAQGILRYEVQARRKLLKTHLGNAPTFADLACDLAQNGNAFLRAKWQDFTKDWKPMTEETTRHRLLLHYRGDPAKARRLYGFWLALNALGRAEYVTAFQVSRDTMRRDLAALEAAEVSLGTGNGLEPLEIADPL